MNTHFIIYHKTICWFPIKIGHIQSQKRKHSAQFELSNYIKLYKTLSILHYIYIVFTCDILHEIKSRFF